jgi:hypothetical protein
MSPLKARLVPQPLNRKCYARNILLFNTLHYEPKVKQQGLQNAEKGQILPISGGKPRKQNLPRQILPIRSYPDISVGIRPESLCDLWAESANSSYPVAPVPAGLPVSRIPTMRPFAPAESWHRPYGRFSLPLKFHGDRPRHS